MAVGAQTDLRVDRRPTSARFPGVSYAEGTVTGYAQFVAPDGKAVSTGGARRLGLSFDPNPQLSSLHLAQGTAPTTSNEVVMDEGTAQKYHFEVGDRVRILLAGPPQTFTISGLVKFGTANNLAGATIAAFDLPTAQRLFNESRAASTPSTSWPSRAPTRRPSNTPSPRCCPPGSRSSPARPWPTSRRTTSTRRLGFFSTALLVFAFISLFVGGFTIFNTFSIIVGQRTRELALLRIVGASRRQVFRSVLVEAAILGLVASLVGLGLGVLAAFGLEALLKGFGISLPSGSLVFEARTVIAAIARGARSHGGLGASARRGAPCGSRPWPPSSTTRASRGSRHDDGSSSAPSSPSSASPRSPSA